MEIKLRIAKTIEERRADILDLSRRIHADPELAFAEVRTSACSGPCSKTRGSMSVPRRTPSPRPFGPFTIPAPTGRG